MERAGDVSKETSVGPFPAQYDDKVPSRSSNSTERSIGGANGHQTETEGVHEKDHVDEGTNGDLEPVKSKAASVSHTASIPNGGTRAWLQVLGSFFLFFNSWGIINTFGSYQTYYETTLLTSTSASAISWIGSIQAFLLMLVGALTGPIYDAGYFRYLLACGTFMLVFGQMMLSLCKEYYQVLLAQAFTIGIGCGCLFIPSVAILNTYFTTKIATAVGVAASGSSLGGVIYPIVFHKLVGQIGFGWATRVLGFMILGTMLIPNIVMKVRVLPANKRSLLDLAAFKSPAYSLNVFGYFIGFMGLYTPFFYSQIFAIDAHLTNANLAFYLLAVMNSASIFGRIIPNFLADKLGPFNVLIPCTVMSGVICLCLIAAKSSAGLIVLMAFYGFFSGTFVSLPPTIIFHLSLDARHKIGTRLGQCFALVGVGMLIGTPIGGAIQANKGFTSLWAYGGSLLVAGALILMLSRYFHKGWKLNVKA